MALDAPQTPPPGGTDCEGEECGYGPREKDGLAHGEDFYDLSS